MHQGAKYFAGKLNQCLDEIDAPASLRDRAAILSSTFDIPKQQAWHLLEGQQFPSEDLLKAIAAEFEVDYNWLVGQK